MHHQMIGTNEYPIETLNSSCYPCLVQQQYMRCCKVSSIMHITKAIEALVVVSCQLKENETALLLVEDTRGTTENQS